MPAIGIVDDRKDQRVTITRQIGVHLPKEQNWEAIDIAPLKRIGDYPSWIAENNISVLTIDERLHEAAEESTEAADYSGHEVVDYLRAKFKTLPIYIISAFSDDEAVQRRCSSVEGIFDRTDFSSHAELYVTRFVRLGTKFYQENRQELERLAELSRKIARGVATPDEIAEAGGLQLSQSLPFEPFQARSEWLTKMEQAVADLSDLEKRIRQHLEDKTGNEVVQD